MPQYYFWLVAICTVQCFTNFAYAESFSTWLKGFRSKALASGVSQKTIDLTTSDLSPDGRILDFQNNQPESIQTLSDYLNSRISSRRIKDAQKYFKQHRPLLDEVGVKYNVQPRFIVALWGLESDFGRATGNWSTVRSLATLAHSGRRHEYFGRELIAALKLIDKQPLKHNVKGSWAGAVGQCQFMPSNVHRLGVDYDKDGHIDIWDSKPDIFASIANYLSKNGWSDDETWGREVSLPSDFDTRLVGHAVRLRLQKWQSLGIRRTNGHDLPNRNLWTSLLLPDGINGRAFLVYEDFRVLLKWNRSDLFALSVGLLSETLREYADKDG